MLFCSILASCSNGKSHPSTKGLNRPISHVKSSPGRLGKNVSSATEKVNYYFFVVVVYRKRVLNLCQLLITSYAFISFQTSHDTQDGNQPSIFKKGRNQLDDNTQSKR